MKQKKERDGPEGVKKEEDESVDKKEDGAEGDEIVIEDGDNEGIKVEDEGQFRWCLNRDHPVFRP